jgi:hypothetical protein
VPAKRMTYNAFIARALGRDNPHEDDINYEKSVIDVLSGVKYEILLDAFTKKDFTKVKENI